MEGRMYECPQKHTCAFNPSMSRIVRGLDRLSLMRSRTTSIWVPGIRPVDFLYYLHPNVCLLRWFYIMISNSLPDHVVSRASAIP